MSDLFPPLESQLEHLGRVRYTSFSTDRDSRLLPMNPSIAQHRGRLLLIERLNYIKSGSPTREWRQNSSHLRLSSMDLDPRLERPVLTNIWEERTDRGHSREDPRLSIRDGKINVWCAFRSTLDPRSPVRQQLLLFDESYHLYDIHEPPHFQNGVTFYQKNWAPIEGTPFFSYWIDGEHITAHLDNPKITYSTPGLTWKYGEIHLGTPCIRVSDYLLLFFQSSREDLFLRRFASDGIYNSRYYVGAALLDPSPPFEIKAWTPTPLLTGSIDNPVRRGSPACIFPAGAVSNKTQVFLAVGVNDCGWSLAELDKDRLLERLQTLAQ